ncbi:methyl-accepting chemotaxis protein [Robbsia sp. KACC 23696]|uniref:methyl-accepting chemotaxis protein n=1 Tax=Robbsia sp. KACC 23696 TaxID=3149231 RepID=UPI00325BC49E
MKNFLGSVRFKISTAMTLCVLLIASIGIFGAVVIGYLNKTVHDEYRQTTLPIRTLGEFRTAATDIKLQVRRIQVLRTADATRQAIAAMQTDVAATRRAWTAYYALSADESPGERGLADQIVGILPALHEQLDGLNAQFTAGDYDGAVERVARYATDSDAMLSVVDKLIAMKDAQALQFGLDSDVQASHARTLAWTLMSLGVLLGIVATAYLLRVITRPLQQAITVANTIAGGTLEMPIEVTSRDEFGVLLDALRRMDAQLAGAVRNIQQSTTAVTQASREIASGNLDLSSRTEEQAASLEQTAASMTEMTEVVERNAEHARQASTLADDARSLALRGDEAVKAMMATIRQVSDQAGKVADISGVIEGIAFQTNILALNAAVEAARAGEQGRGFAVVASEVRALAQRSAAAAKEITAMVGTSVTVIDNSASEATRVSETIGAVRDAIQNVASIVGEIAAASDEQHQGIVQVNQAVTQMDEVTQQNAALVEQASAAAHALEAQAEMLSTAVSGFTLSGQTRGRTGIHATATADRRIAPSFAGAV